jgi:hypothetical protein
MRIFKPIQNIDDLQSTAFMDHIAMGQDYSRNRQNLMTIDQSQTELSAEDVYWMRGQLLVPSSAMKEDLHILFISLLMTCT